MNVLIACEQSGVVREAFRAKGHNAWSCDILRSDIVGKHYNCTVEHVLSFRHDWDMMIAHPPCTFLSNAGNKHKKNPERQHDTQAAKDFFMFLADTNIKKIAIENPIGSMSTYWRKPDQIVQPFWFGDRARKPTCLWLKNLPKLVPTNMVDEGEIHITKSGKRIPAWYNLPPGPDRAKIRSKTFQGFANAMAEQWG